MNGLELTTTLNTLAVILAQMLDDDQLALMAASLTQMGDTLNTIAAEKASREC